MNDTKDSLPEILDPTDVCSAMDDLAFMEYCYSHFDVNHDHKVGLHEARAVREIDLSDSKVVSLRGIEYFTNLERLILDRSMVKELDLRQNTKLREVSVWNCLQLTQKLLPQSLPIIPNNEIWYTSTDGSIVEPHNPESFGAKIVSNTYQNGKGLIIFDCNIASIGKEAFMDCLNLKSVNIPNHTETICALAFSGCVNMRSIIIPPSINQINCNAFYRCDNLKDVQISDLVSWCNIKFDNEVKLSNGGNNKWISPKSNPLSVGADLILNGELIEELVIPAGVSHICDCAFCGCRSIKKVIIPRGITSIGEQAFCCCTNLETVVLNEDISVINSHTFWRCYKLENIIIPSSVMEIGERAFEQCTSIWRITIPSSVKKLRRWAFNSCWGLKYATIKCDISALEPNVFHDCRNLKTVTSSYNLASCQDSFFGGCYKLRLTPALYFRRYDEFDDESEETYNDYNGTYAQDVRHLSDQVIGDAFDGEADAYWNID